MTFTLLFFFICRGLSKFFVYNIFSVFATETNIFLPATKRVAAKQVFLSATKRVFFPATERAAAKPVIPSETKRDATKRVF